MIRSIHIKNFFSFKDCKIDLSPNHNLLVGINGAGKSNFMKAIRLLKEGVTVEDGIRKLVVETWGGIDSIVHLGKNTENNPVELVFEFNHLVLRKYGFQFNQSLFYKLTIGRQSGSTNYYLSERIYQTRKGFPDDWIYLDITNGNGVAHGVRENEDGVRQSADMSRNQTGLIRYSGLNPQESALQKDITDPSRYYALSTLRKAVSELTVYEYFDTSPTSQIRKPYYPAGVGRLFSNGSNLPQVLNIIRLNDRESYSKIRTQLREINPNFLDFGFNNVGPNIELWLEENGLNRYIPVAHISDGTLRFLCLLAILNNSNRGSVVCIDEPEVGLHPDMISLISDAIIEAGSQTQLFIATHSDTLLNYFDIPDVRVFEKAANSNETIVRKFRAEDFKDWYEEFSLGKMWRQGDIGGNRY